MTVAQRNPWKHFPEDGRSLPHPGQPLPAVPLGGGIVGAGVVDLVDRLRRIQQRHREDGSFIKLPDRLRSQFERRLRAGEGASVPEAIDGALQLLASSWECGTWPAVRGARIHPDTVELVVDHPGGSVRIPPPFVDAGGFLRVDRGVLASRSRRFGRAQGRSPVPTLVTAGTAGGGVLLVDLESLGSLLVNGDEAGCENVIRALALELATSHWSGRFDVVLVGFGAEFERFERVTSVSDPQPLVLELCRRRLHGDALRNNAQVKSFAAARWFDDDACWAPLVVVCGPSVAAGSVQELLEVGSDPLGGTAVVAVGARRGGNGAAHSVRLTGGAPSAPLEQLAAVLTPQQVDADEFAEVAAILDVAEEKDSAPPSDDPYRDLQVPLPVAQPVAPAPGPPTPATARSVPFDRIRGGGSPTVHTRLDRPLVGDEEEDALDVIASITDAVGGETHQVGCEESEASSRRAPDTADPRPELREVEVLVLGPVEIRGASREFTRAWAKELVVYLAMHSRGASNEAWATALWPDRLMAPSSLHSTASVARRALGQSRGGADHLPRSHGRLALGPTVGTDWDRFVSLADSGQPAQWRSALELVRGRPFEGLRSSDWPILEGIGPAIESSVVDLSGRLGRIVSARRRRTRRRMVRSERSTREPLRRAPVPDASTGSGPRQEIPQGSRQSWRSSSDSWQKVSSHSSRCIRARCSSTGVSPERRWSRARVQESPVRARPARRVQAPRFQVRRCRDAVMSPRAIVRRKEPRAERFGLSGRELRRQELRRQELRRQELRRQELRLGYRELREPIPPSSAACPASRRRGAWSRSIPSSPRGRRGSSLSARSEWSPR